MKPTLKIRNWPARPHPAALFTAFLLVPAAAFAATLHVWQDSPSPAPPYATWATAATNIQDAVDVALAGDEIVVTNGLFAVGARMLSGSLTRVVVDKAVAVRSVNGPAVTMIEGYRVHDANAVRCMYLAAGATLDGFALTNGAAVNDYGGGVLCASANSFVTNCVLTGNLAYVSDYGGGGGAYRGTLNNCILTGNRAEGEDFAFGWGGGAHSCVLSNCSLSNNSADENGGGATTSVLNGCTLTGNTAGNGGGAYASTLINCTVSSNRVGSSGGSGGGAALSRLVNCVLFGNSTGSGGSGGGAGYYSILNRCVLTGNLADTGGGASFYSILNNCVLTGNSAIRRSRSGGSGGGASYCTLNNCTIVSNSAAFSGGGVFLASLTNSIVHYNSATNEPNYLSCDFNFSCTTPMPTNGVGNLTNEPAFASQAAGNYRLRPESPCIDAGTNLGATISNDLDGNPRPLDGNRDGIALFDMGAYEFYAPPCIARAAAIVWHQLSPERHMQVAFRGTPNAVHTVEMFNFSNATVVTTNLTADAQGDFLFTDPLPATRPVLFYKAWPLPPPGHCPPGAQARPIWTRGCITAYDCAVPASGVCVRNSLQPCAKDSDCHWGGCGGELCYNPSLGPRGTGCDCTQPRGVICGCVNGQCMWFYVVNVP